MSDFKKFFKVFFSPDFGEIINLIIFISLTLFLTIIFQIFQIKRLEEINPGFHIMAIFLMVFILLFFKAWDYANKLESPFTLTLAFLSIVLAIWYPEGLGKIGFIIGLYLVGSLIVYVLKERGYDFKITKKKVKK